MNDKIIIAILLFAFIGFIVCIKNIVVHWKLSLFASWYLLSAIHVRYFFKTGWYECLGCYEKDTWIWASLNWVFSPVATTGYYLYLVTRQIAYFAVDLCDVVISYLVN